MTAQTAVKLIAGTVPLYRSYLLVHHPLPPSSYPAKLAAFSPVLTSIQTRSAAWSMASNLVYLGQQQSLEPTDDFEPQTEADATLFDFEKRKGYKIPRLSTTFLNTRTDPNVPMQHLLRLDDAEEDHSSYLFVCTHGQRDCRCGDTGGAVISELRKSAPSELRVGEISHVGGHKYAANVLLFPSGDWFGDVQPEHIDLILRYVADGFGRIPNELIPHWRGGRGLAKEDQLSLARDWLATRD